MKLTKRRRHQIYKKATKDYFCRGSFDRFHAGLCYAISRSIVFDEPNPYKTEDLDINYPEFYLFSPENYRDDWWSNDREDHQARAMGLAFMIAMSE